MNADVVLKSEKLPQKRDPSKYFYKVTLEGGESFTTFESSILNANPGDLLEFETERKGDYLNLTEFRITPMEQIVGPKRPDPVNAKQGSDNERILSIEKQTALKVVGGLLASDPILVPEDLRALFYMKLKEMMAGKKLGQEFPIKEQSEWQGEALGDNHIDEVEASDTSVEVEEAIEEVGSPVATSDWGNCPDHGPMVESKYAPGRPFCNNKDKQDKWCKVWK